jgi:hypothetical protein
MIIAKNRHRGRGHGDSADCFPLASSVVMIEMTYKHTKIHQKRHDKMLYQDLVSEHQVSRCLDIQAYHFSPGLWLVPRLADRRISAQSFGLGE